MRRHILLTGDIQVGKSTIIQKILHELDISAGGFRTIWGDPFFDGRSDLFLLGIGEVPSPERIAATRHGHGCGITAFPEIFDTVGTHLIDEASSSSLIIMDELGFLEKDAEKFQRAVLSALTSSIPILGVVRNMQNPFLDRVRAHPDVDVIVVTEENRDELYCRLLERFKKGYAR